MLVEFASSHRGFLHADDPCTSLDDHPLDELGRHLPSLVEDRGFRQYILEYPFEKQIKSLRYLLDFAPEQFLELLYVRLGFIVSAYVNQVGSPVSQIVPANLAQPFCQVCKILQRPPILSYDGYALYNWKRFRPNEPVALGNIDTIQNFVHLYDEHWFILVHVEIEALAEVILKSIAAVQENPTAAMVNQSLKKIADSVWSQVTVLKRIPEKMDPALYYKRFRPYIRFFENVVFEGVSEQPMSYRGETGAQSSILPALVSFLKIPHKQSMLTDHLTDMRNFMPAKHREVLAEIDAMPDIRDMAEPEVFDEVLEAIASFREVHYEWALEYIHRRTDDERGTGGTPYAKWLKQLIEETRQHKIEGK